MKVMVCGVLRLGGKSKAGNDFDMCQIKVLRPAESFMNEKLKCVAYGFESVDLELDKDALPDFAELRFPVVLDLTLEDKFTRKGIESIVVGFTTPTKAVPADTKAI